MEEAAISISISSNVFIFKVYYGYGLLVFTVFTAKPISLEAFNNTFAILYIAVSR